MSTQPAKHYLDAAQQLPADMLKEDFSMNGLTEKEVKALQTKVLFEENSMLLGMDSGSVGGVNKRGAAAQDEKRKLEQQKVRKQKDASDIIVYLIAQFDAYEDHLADKYGEDFAAQWATDLFDKETAKHIASLPVEQQRLATWKEIDKGLSDGSLTVSQLTPEQRKFHEDGAAKYRDADYESDMVLNNGKSADDISDLGKEVGKDKALAKAPEMKSQFEVASVEVKQSEATLDNTEEQVKDVNLTMKI